MISLCIREKYNLKIKIDEAYVYDFIPQCRETLKPCNDCLIFEIRGSTLFPKCIKDDTPRVVNVSFGPVHELCFRFVHFTCVHGH